MNLHHRIEEFEELIELTSNQVNIPSGAVRKDYFITIILKNLAESEYLEHVVFKGGTSLSKCYPGSIDVVIRINCKIKYNLSLSKSGMIC